MQITLDSNGFKKNLTWQQGKLWIVKWATELNLRKTVDVEIYKDLINISLTLLFSGVNNSCLSIPINDFQKNFQTL